MGTKAACDFLDFFFGFALSVIYEYLCTAFDGDIAFAPSVDTDDTHAEAARGNLCGKMAELVKIGTLDNESRINRKEKKCEILTPPPAPSRTIQSPA